MIAPNQNNGNGNGNGNNGFQLTWQNIIMTIILFLSIGGAFWALAYNPIQSNIAELKNEVSILRSKVETGDEKNRQLVQEHQRHDTQEFLTIKEHNEFKLRTDKSIEDLKSEIKDMDHETERRRSENTKKYEDQQKSFVSKTELMSEIKRLEQTQEGNMKRSEFETWKAEQNKLIINIQDRMKTFTEALDSLYTKVVDILIQLSRLKP